MPDWVANKQIGTSLTNGVRGSGAEVGPAGPGREVSGA